MEKTLISRQYNPLDAYLEPNKALVLYGPRRVGKTTLLRLLLGATKLKYRFDSGENIRVQEVLTSRDFRKMREYVGRNELIVIDEAQHIPGIGEGLKIIVDQIPGIYVVATGSSSFDLSSQVGEPLVGRKRTLILYPFAQKELTKTYDVFDIKNRLEEFLIYGSYPDVVMAETAQEKKTFLSDIVDAYLLKDVLAFEGIKKSKTLVDLVKLLALQVGSEVSLSELAEKLGTAVRTVEKYLDVLEKGFVVFSLGALKRNLRNEIRSKKKYYFYDTGVRNAILSQFNDLSLRQDVGALWENFLVSERIKRNAYTGTYANYYYWRTYEQKEIDWIEERDGQFFAYEFKWRKDRVSRPKMFLEAYESSSFEVVTRETYWEFI